MSWRVLIGVRLRVFLDIDFLAFNSVIQIYECNSMLKKSTSQGCIACNYRLVFGQVHTPDASKSLHVRKRILLWFMSLSPTDNVQSWGNRRSLRNPYFKEIG